MDYGNPGNEYEKSRHNAGFRVIDELSKKMNIEVTKKKFDAIIGEGIYNFQKVMLVKPQTYMNLSGNSVKQIVDFYKIELEELIVIYDDIDIELGKIRIRKSGSSGTHNGMRNIVSMIQSEGFPRVRVGTDKPKYQVNLADYVLMPISKEENELLSKGVLKSANAVCDIITNGIQSAMNKFN